MNETGGWHQCAPGFRTLCERDGDLAEPTILPLHF